eukprot:7382656-Prymnesium_polylepis.1
MGVPCVLSFAGEGDVRVRGHCRGRGRADAVRAARHGQGGGRAAGRASALGWGEAVGPSDGRRADGAGTPESPARRGRVRVGGRVDARGRA